MKVYCVHEITFFGNSPRVNAVHAAMFHGLDEDPTETDVNASRRTLPGASRTPLLLTCNAYSMPQMFMPGVTFIVSDKIRSQLAILPNIEFLPVIFKKLVWQPYRAGEFDWQPPAYGGDDSRLFKRLHDRPDLRSSVGPYFELLHWRLSAVAGKYQELKEVHVDLGTFGSFPSVDLTLSDRLVADYPIVGALGALIFNERAFEIVDEHLNRDYFHVVPVTV